MKDPDTHNKDAELEQQMAASMHVDNDDVPYPDTDAWHNLGQQTRARATQRGTPRQRILRALMWPAAAAMLAIVLRFVSTDTPSVEQITEKPSERTQQVMMAIIDDPIDNDNGLDTQLRALEILELQAELDTMAIDFDADDDALYDAVLNAYGMESVTVLYEYFDAL
ncbi:MAG: hypothetical protein ACKJSG_00330 [Lentisphaeria bacterium]